MYSFLFNPKGNISCQPEWVIYNTIEAGERMDYEVRQAWHPQGPPVASWWPESDLNSELQMSLLWDTNNSSTSLGVAEVCEKMTDLKHIALTLALEGDPTPSHWKKKKEKKKSDCIYCSTLTPFTISKNVLEAGEVKSIKSCWIQEHRKVLIREMRREMNIDQRWQVKSTTEQTADSRDSSAGMNTEQVMWLNICKPQPSHLWNEDNDSVSSQVAWKKILQGKPRRPLYSGCYEKWFTWFTL